MSSELASEAGPAEYPPQINQEQLSYLTSEFTDYALAHGLLVRPQPSFVKSNPNNALATVAPITLLPSPFPRKPFEAALAIQTAYNELYARIASDEEFLSSLIPELAQVDDFMKKLWQVHLDVKAKGYKQSISLGLFRSDYMIHLPEGGEPMVQQVEFNTISSSFAALSTRVSQLHKFLFKVGAYPPTEAITQDSLPPNEALKSLASGLADSHQAYLQQSNDVGKSGHYEQQAVLFLVQQGERNAFDQRWLEYVLLEKYNVDTYRLSLSEIPEHTTMSEDGTLLFHLPHDPKMMVEITTIYFRAGYGPDDYTSDTHWQTRAYLEESRAIKCPTVLTQLAGAKKIQQVLAKPANLSKFVSLRESQLNIQKTFTSIYPLDQSEEGLHARHLAFTNPERYVVKPQREGGGNNIYRDAIPAFLKSIPEESWKGYILMELIQPPAVENFMARNGEIVKKSVIGELGVYGTILWDTKKDGKVEVLSNEEAGWLLRTKARDSDEGGVAAGFGCVDSVVLLN